MKVTLLLLLLFFLSTNVYSLESEYSYGGLISFTSFTVNDPAGSVDNSNAITKIGGVFNVHLNKDTALFSNVYYYSDEFKASTSNYGMKAKGYGFSSSYAKRLRLSRSFKPWFTAGLALNNYIFSERYIIDSDGFSINNPSDRKEISASWLIGVSVFQKISRDYQFLYHFGYDNSFGYSTGGFSLTFAVLYK